jgi:molybdenum cofactor synthesis domain-containing protein
MVPPVGTAAILVIGNEVLSGKVEEENARFLIRELRPLGVDLQRIVVIKDDPDAIAREVRAMSERHAHVFTSGGVGGTHDDVTMEGIAQGFGVPLERHPELEALIRRHYKERTNEDMLRMADVPKGAVLLGVGEILFPVVAMKNVYVLPGVPEFLRMKFEVLRPRLRQASVFTLRQIFVRVGEDAIAALMRQTQAALPGLEIGSYPRFDTAAYKVKITVEARDPELVALGMKRLLEGIPPADVVSVE